MTGADLSIIIKKHPIVVSCTIVSLLSAVLYYYEADTLVGAKSNLDEKFKESRVMISNVRNSVNLSQQTEAMQKAAKLLEGRLVKASQMATNLQYFYRLESDTGVKITDVRQNLEGRPSKSLYLGIPYSVTFQGKYKQVQEFLQKIESGKHFSKFNTISFNKTAGSDANSALLSVSMNIELLGIP